jgi:hypothetical protein
LRNQAEKFEKQAGTGKLTGIFLNPLKNKRIVPKFRDSASGAGN